MSDYEWGRSIRGTDQANNMIVDFAAADAVFQEDTVWWPGIGYIDVQYYWNRVVEGLGGNDVILRDRPGDYKVGPDDGNVALYGGTRTNDGGHLDTGIDTVSYAMYGAGVDIDLATPEGYGTATANAIAGFEIFGFDRLYGFENATGSGGNDRIWGSAGANVLHGGNGNDDLRGEGGNDHLYGDAGNDVMRGDTGVDYLYGGTGADTIYGGDSGDLIEGGDQDDALYGSAGSDALYGGAGNDTLLGGDSDDVLHGGDGHNSLNGGDGNDSLYVEGTGGSAVGGYGNDVIVGSSGNDNLKGDVGLDTMNGGNGNDTLEGGANSDIITGGSGTDRAVWVGGAAVVVTLNDAGNGSAQQSGFNDTLSGIEQVVTGSGHDVITLGAQANWVDANYGNDLVNAGSGNDTVYADAGNDTVYGSWGDDRLYGEAGQDRLDGGRDDDRLYGGSENDLIRGGEGADVLNGGSGRDGFVFASGDWGIDVIEDFVIGEDWIGFDDFLASPVPMGGSYVGKVFAFSAENGNSTVLTALTDGGWESFAILRGYDDPNEVWDAIQDRSLFTGPILGDGGPGGIVF